MRTCSRCGKVYDDVLSFCLDDGEALVSAAPPPLTSPTVIRGSSIGQQKESSAPMFFFLAAIIVIIVVFMIGMVGAGWFLLHDRSAQIAASNSNSSTSGPGNAGPINRPNNTSVNLRAPYPPPGPSNSNLSNAKPASIPKTISGGVLNGKAISLPKPPYPPAARAVRASGTVSVQVLIDREGNVISASAVNGHPLLRAAAEAAAREAKFSPTLLSGQPVTVSGIVTYNFVP